MATRELLASPLYVFSNPQLGANSPDTPLSSTANLHQSILDGRLRQVKYLIQFGCKVNARDIYGRTCLMLASLCNHEDYGYKLAKLLIKNGADLNMQDFMGRTAVTLACSEQRERLYSYFLEEHAMTIDFRLQDNDGNTLINYAAIYATPTMLSLTIQKMNQMHVSVDQRNSLGYTAFLLAIKNMRYTNAYILITEGNASPFLKDNELFLNGLEWLINTAPVDTDLEVVKSPTNLRTSTKSLQRGKSSEMLSQLDSNSFTDFRKEFTMSKANTSSSLLSSNASGTSNSNIFQYQRNPITYKTWYGAPNQYYESLSVTAKCEHLNHTNYSTDCHNSRYTPAIFTPRYNQFVMPESRKGARRTGNLSREQELHLDYQDDMVYKLLDKIRERMMASAAINQTNSGHTNTAPDSICSSAAMHQNDSEHKMMANGEDNHSQQQHSQVNINERHLVLLTTSARSLRSAVSLSQPQSQPSQPQTANQPYRNKRLMQQQNNPLFLSQQLLPAIPSTAKLLALQPKSKTTIKSDLHKIFQCYNGLNTNRTLKEHKLGHGQTSSANTNQNNNSATTTNSNHTNETSNNKKPNRSIIQKNDKNSSAANSTTTVTQSHSTLKDKENRVKEVTFNLE